MLVAFIRIHAPRRQDTSERPVPYVEVDRPDKPRADVQAVLTAVAHLGFGDLTLEGLHLRGAELGSAQLRRVKLTVADLRGTRFEGADLRGAGLRGARSLTQDQIDSARRGDERTDLRNTGLQRPAHWTPRRE
ncbi:pentapeptide repeat-containing protein [Saccharopolyspora sp. NPDC050389]|uniref:pentapeptide repeat-containing protein n=1 Tax=Saccharopolyspora sp. NPDC050389 TaxID=3155516 RepID=UPI0033D1DE6A